MTRTAHLRRLLEAHVPQDALEREHRARIDALLESGAVAFEREHFAPGHFTASAFIVDAKREHVLLILHGKLRRWLQPGGHVDAVDADVVDTARREVAEETGLSSLPLTAAGVFDLDVHEIPARADTPAHEHFDLRFVFEAPYAAGRAGSDAQAVRWVPIAQLLRRDPSSAPELPTDESVLRALRKLQAVFA
jgi:8-oxo-dGTP pyrophosphatase MutT (NUDIX family)